jgi:primosomal protein DnaI
VKQLKKLDELIKEEGVNQDSLIREVLENPEVKAFINDHKLGASQIRDNLSVFMAYVDKTEICTKCHSLSACGQNISGHVPQLVFDEGEVLLDYMDCSFSQKDHKEKSKYTTLKTMFINPQVVALKDIYKTIGREKIIESVTRFIKTYSQNPKQKGIYVYGSFGCGKTYLMSFLAVQMALRGCSVLFAYYPDLVRRIKSAIGTRDFEAIIEEMKNVDILILDDLGGESNTSFIRDEILGPVLQARMIAQKPLFITSNLPEPLLVEHLADGKESIDGIKATRIFERIRTLCDIVCLQDKNYRHNGN